MKHPSEIAATLLACAALAACSPRDNNLTPKTAPAPSATPAVPAAPAGVAAPPCPPEAPVKIDDIVINGSAATVSFNPDPRQIGKNAGGVRWTLKSPQGKTYVFATDGVTFKPGAPAGPVSAPATGKPDEYVWCFDATTTDLSWPYKVKFYDTTLPATVWVCDPTIINFEGLNRAAQVSVACVPQ